MAFPHLPHALNPLPHLPRLISRCSHSNVPCLGRLFPCILKFLLQLPWLGRRGWPWIFVSVTSRIGTLCEDKFLRTVPSSKCCIEDPQITDHRLLSMLSNERHSPQTSLPQGTKVRISQPTYKRGKSVTARRSDFPITASFSHILRQRLDATSSACLLCHASSDTSSRL